MKQIDPRVMRRELLSSVRGVNREELKRQLLSATRGRAPSKWKWGRRAARALVPVAGAYGASQLVHRLKANQPAAPGQSVRELPKVFYNRARQLQTIAKWKRGPEETLKAWEGRMKREKIEPPFIMFKRRRSESVAAWANRIARHHDRLEEAAYYDSLQKREGESDGQWLMRVQTMEAERSEREAEEAKAAAGKIPQRTEPQVGEIPYFEYTAEKGGGAIAPYTITIIPEEQVTKRGGGYAPLSRTRLVPIKDPTPKAVAAAADEQIRHGIVEAVAVLYRPSSPIAVQVQLQYGILHIEKGDLHKAANYIANSISWGRPLSAGEMQVAREVARRVGHSPNGERLKRALEEWHPRIRRAEGERESEE